jgi:hypothetical protein
VTHIFLVYIHVDQVGTDNNYYLRAALCCV